MNEGRSYTGWFVVIALLLVLLVGAEGYRLYVDFQDRAAREEYVEAVDSLMNLQRTMIMDVMDDYREAAYSDPNVERIAEQQLLAEEFQLMTLQVLAIQNGQIMELLANVR